MPLSLKILTIAGIYCGLLGSFLLAVEAIGADRIKDASRVFSWLLGSRYETPFALMLLLGFVLAAVVGYLHTPPAERGVLLHWPIERPIEAVRNAGVFTLWLIFLPIVTLYALRAVVDAALRTQDRGIAGVAGFVLIAAGCALQTAAVIMV